MGRPIQLPVDSSLRLSGHGEEVKYMVGNIKMEQRWFGGPVGIGRMSSEGCTGEGKEKI